MITVNQSAHSLLGIVNDILDFSKLKRETWFTYRKHKIKDILSPIMDLILYESKKKASLRTSVALKIPTILGR
jgi:signal transduction histidine kinase